MEPTPLQRALKVAPDKATAAKARPEQEFFCFKLGDLQLAVPSENVREVLRATTMTPLPRSPPFIVGVCGQRGEVLPVMDLLRFLGKGEARIASRSRLFVGVAQSYVTAVIADAVVGLERFALADILPPPMGADVSSEHLTGVVQTKNGRLISLLNFTKVLQAARQRAVAR